MLHQINVKWSWSCEWKPVISDDFWVCVDGVLGSSRPFGVIKVHVVQSKLLSEAAGPFKVVHQRPSHVAPDVYTIPLDCWGKENKMRCNIRMPPTATKSKMDILVFVSTFYTACVLVPVSKNHHGNLCLWLICHVTKITKWQTSLVHLYFQYWQYNFILILQRKI